MFKYRSITEDQIDLINIIHTDSNLTQRQIAKKTGLSVGKVNYCLKALIDIGFIKVDNFRKSSQKMKYTYILTPKGIREKTALTKQFVIKKKKEYDKLKSYIS